MSKKHDLQIKRIEKAIKLLELTWKSGCLYDRPDWEIDVLGRVKGAVYLLRDAHKIQKSRESMF